MGYMRPLDVVSIQRLLKFTKNFYFFLEIVYNKLFYTPEQQSKVRVSLKRT